MPSGALSYPQESSLSSSAPSNLLKKTPLCYAHCCTTTGSSPSSSNLS